MTSFRHIQQKNTVQSRHDDNSAMSRGE